MKSAEFKKLVSKEIGPFLRENGWKGSGFQFNKHDDHVIKAITFQPSSAGSKFCIEVGVHFDFIPLRVEKDLKKLKTWSMEMRTRLSNKPGCDCWWQFPESEKEKETLFAELKYLFSNQAVEYFSIYDKWEEHTNNFTPEEIENKEAFNFFPMTKMRTALMMARIEMFRQQPKKAISFSNYGLSKIDGNKGSALIPLFEEIIQSATESVGTQG